MCILTVAIGKEETYNIFNACFDELNRNMYLKCGKQFSLSQTCLWVSRRLQWRRGSAVACCRAGALSAAVQAWDLLKEVTITTITPTIVWSKTKQDPVFPTISPSHPEACTSLLSSSIRRQTE